MKNKISFYSDDEVITHYDIVDNNIIVHYLDGSTIKLPNKEHILERVRKDQIYQAEKYVKDKVDLCLPIALGAISVLSYAPTVLTGEGLCTTVSVLGTISSLYLLKDSIELIRDKKKYDFYLMGYNSFKDYSNKTYIISNEKKPRTGTININNVDNFTYKQLKKEYALIKKYRDYELTIKNDISFEDFDKDEETKRKKIFPTPNFAIIKKRK